MSSERITDNIYFLKGLGYSSNTYIMTSEDECLIIDPGLPSNIHRLLDFLHEHSLLNRKCVILLTHMHFDHMGAVTELVKRLRAEVAVHELERTYIESGDPYYTVAIFFGADRLESVKVDRVLKNGDVIDVGSKELRIIHTPGHTIGSICIYDYHNELLFSGDTLFSDGSFGRTDLPTGNMKELRRSLDKIEELDANILCPGHGEVSRGNIKEIIKVARQYIE